MQIDTIQQRSAHFTQVALNNGAGTAAFARGIGEVAARARIHSSDEDEVGGERQRHVGTRQSNRRFFQWLAQHFEDVAREFGQLVQETGRRCEPGSLRPGAASLSRLR